MTFPEIVESKDLLWGRTCAVDNVRARRKGILGKLYEIQISPERGLRNSLKFPSYFGMEYVRPWNMGKKLLELYFLWHVWGIVYVFFPSRTAKFKTSNSEDLLGVLCLKNHGLVYLPATHFKPQKWIERHCSNMLKLLLFIQNPVSHNEHQTSDKPKFDPICSWLAHWKGRFCSNPNDRFKDPLIHWSLEIQTNWDTSRIIPLILGPS